MSSLLFVVILAVWAVYLVQHWVRRRDHVATARSVDRYSEAMRVLERRRALPRPDVGDLAPASYSVSPLRPARPQVVVKRGMPQLASSSEARSSAAPRRATGATAVGPAPSLRRARRAARLRAAALLLASVAMVTLVALGAGQVIHLGWSFAGVGALAVTLVVVRRSASAASQAAARRRRAARGQRVVPPSIRTTADEQVHTTDQAEDSPLAAQARATVATARTARREVDLTAAARPTLYDIDAVEASLVTVASQRSAALSMGAEDDASHAPGSWSPTPVPPPTYTLKAKAYRSPSGSPELPADGTEMALEEEFEDLPRVDRVV